VNLAALTARLGVRRGPAAPPRRTVAADYAAPPAAEVLARRIALAEAVESEGVALYAHDGSLLAATPALERLVGARAVSLAGDGLLQRLDVGDRPAFLRALASAVADAADVTVAVRCRQGGEGIEALDDGRWIDLDVQFRRTAPGDPVGPAVIARLTDASVRRADADEIRRLREALSATIAGRSRELGLVGHELRDAAVGDTGLRRRARRRHTARHRRRPRARVRRPDRRGGAAPDGRRRRARRAGRH
jgi:hypothetical protein